MDWKTMLAYITGSVDRELLLRNEYLVVENRILRNQLQGRLRLTDGERRPLAEIGKQLGRRALEEVASIGRPETILGWHRKLVARKFDGSKNRAYPGRPDRRQHFETAWHRARAGAPKDHDVEGVHPLAHGRPCGDGFLHRGSADQDRGSSRTTCCSSYTWLHGAFTLPASHRIPMASG